MHTVVSLLTRNTRVVLGRLLERRCLTF